MSEQDVAPSGGETEVASGTEETQHSKDSVAYDTYRKVLSEKKKRDEQLSSIQAELESLRAQQKEREEAELKDQNRWKELYESLHQENSQLKSSLSEKDQRWESAIKLDSFYRALNGRVIDSKYAGFIDTSKILLDPETGEVDQTTVQREVERIQKEYPEIIKGGQAKSLPAQAPQGVHSGGVKSLKDLSKAEKMAMLSKAIRRKKEDSERITLGV